MNRLQLDFSITLRSERNNFIKEYLQRIPFTPTSSELEMMSKYILWGKENLTQSDGPARLKQDGIELDTRHSTWIDNKLVSLDGILESTDSPDKLFFQSTQVSTRILPRKFSRQEAKTEASPLVLSNLESLWKEIDNTELLIQLYKQLKNPNHIIRAELLNRFSEEEFEAAKQKALKLTPAKFLSLKHLLVELREQQYTLRESYKTTITTTSKFAAPSSSAPINFDINVDIKPMGIPYAGSLYKKIFNPNRFPNPWDFTEDELKIISDILWTNPKTDLYFDFTNVNHLYTLYGMYDDLLDGADRANNSLSTLPYFLQALQTYRALAQLDPFLEDILDMKIKRYSTQCIAQEINKKYNTHYQPNYISTLYCKKCLQAIADTAKFHREVLENVFFEENFKRCKDCGEIYLLHENNFVRQKRSATGFSPRCKKCEKIKRTGGMKHE